MVASNADAGSWVLLTYRLPREPSTPRASVWRKLRRLGVAQLADGLVALPQDARTREHLEWIAEEVLAAGGTAILWQARPTTPDDERQVALGMAQGRTREYDALTARADAVLTSPPTERRRALRSLRTELRAIRRRDYFSARGRDEAVAAVGSVADAVTREADAPTGVTR